MKIKYLQQEHFPFAIPIRYPSFARPPIFNNTMFDLSIIKLITLTNSSSSVFINILKNKKVTKYAFIKINKNYKLF